MLDQRRRPFFSLALVLLALAAGGCGHAHSIMALPPEPVVPVDSSAAGLPDAELARVEVQLRIDGTPLPDEVSQIRLRPTEVWFHASGGAWTDLPTSAGIVTIGTDRQEARLLVATQLPPAAYDSIEVVFDEVYVEFGENAGGPITSSDPPSTKRAVAVEAEIGTVSTIDLVLDAGASIIQDAACRWHFLPFVRVDQ